MDKVIVAYWSQTGNTAAMAAAIGEGITEAGKEAVVTDISSVSMDDLKAAAAKVSIEDAASRAGN